MSPNISLSIITPVFNSERYIEKCIENVVDQQADVIEHLIMDGGSSDKTVQIANQYAATHTHIRVFSEKDAGQSDAMNKGIEKARGKFITFLNVDDYFEPDALKWVLAKIAEAGEHDFLVGNCFVRNLQGDIQSHRKPKHGGYPEILEFWRRDVFPSNPSSYFYSRKLHDLAGMYDVNEHFVLDYEMLIRLFKYANVRYFDVNLGNFVLHEETKTYQNAYTGEKITKLEVFNRYKQQLPLVQKMLLQLKFYYHIRLKRSNNPILFFGLRPGYAFRRIGEKLKFRAQ